MELYEKALEIATKAHAGQTRKFGEDKGKPYIVHPIRVAECLKKEHDYPAMGTEGYLEATGVLHDVLEDSEVTAQELLDQGIPKMVVDAVDILSKKEGESYYDFIMRIVEGVWNKELTESYQLALFVKIADIKDNCRDLKEGQIKDKYRLALYVLEDRLSEFLDLCIITIVD